MPRPSVGLTTLVEGDELVLVFLERREAFEAPVPPKADAGAPAGPGNRVPPVFFLSRAPIRGTAPDPAEGTPDQGAHLIQAWSRLRSVARLDERTLADLMTVLLEARPIPPAKPPNLPPLDPDPEKRIFRPTAAHPRAYRGTRDRPPKPRLPGTWKQRCPCSRENDKNSP